MFNISISIHYFHAHLLILVLPIKILPSRFSLIPSLLQSNSYAKRHDSFSQLDVNTLVHKLIMYQYGEEKMLHVYYDVVNAIDAHIHKHQ